MSIKLEDLQAEKGLLQKDFDEMRRNISRVETDLAQMKANLNAINGAMQQTNKLIKMAAEAEVKVTPSVKAKKKWKNLSLS